jgi:hypothetical protein
MEEFPKQNSHSSPGKLRKHLVKRIQSIDLIRTGRVIASKEGYRAILDVEPSFL